MSLKRELIKQFLPAYVRQGFNASQTLKILRAQGMGYRKQNFLKDFAKAAGYVQKAERFKNTRKDRYGNRETLSEKKLREGVNFQFQVRLRGYDITTGEMIEQYVTIESQSNLTRAQIEDIALTSYGDINNDGYLNAFEATAISGFYDEEYW